MRDCDMDLEAVFEFEPDPDPDPVFELSFVPFALVACSVFCLRPFMAAVSTNYGTAGDSTLENSASL
jgi:hypothetical protein